LESNKVFLEFKELFELTPNMLVLNINNGLDDVKEFLDLITSNHGRIVYKDINELEQQRFRLNAREYEYALVCNCFDTIEALDRFIKEVYKSVENSGQIILIEKKENGKLQEMIELLDRNDFRSTNPIDIFPNYDLVMAKKMHMWGNGL
jgi:hypothetical protein